MKRPYMFTKKEYELYTNMFKFENVFYHFSLVKFDKLKDINSRGTVSMFFSKPDIESIKNLRKNKFLNYGSEKETYYIYKIELFKQLNKTLFFYIASTPDEQKQYDNDEFLNNSYKGRSDWLVKHGKRKIYFEDYFEMLDNIDLTWLNFPQMTKEQIEICKIYKKYKGLYAACIPHLIVGCKPGEEFNIIKRDKFFLN